MQTLTLDLDATLRNERQYAAQRATSVPEDVVAVENQSVYKLVC